MSVIERYGYDIDKNLPVSKYEDEQLQIDLAVRKYEMRKRKRYRVEDEPIFSKLQARRPSYRYGDF